MTARAKPAQWALTGVFFAAVIWLLRDELRALDPRAVWAVLRATSAPRIAASFALTAVSYAVVASYDRLASRLVGVRLPAALGFSIPFVSYAFNFNIGAIVGALGFRYRLYTRAGVDSGRIAAIAVGSIVTNWCGCLTVLGAMLLAEPSALPIGWGLSPVTGRGLGAAALVPVAAYGVAARIRRAPVRWRGATYRLPPARFALAQIGLASAFWLLVPLVICALAPAGAPIRYAQVAVAFALSALGGLVVRIPAGLGVLEAVFLELFRGRVAAEAILGMLIAWRAVFLFVPLLLASVVLAALEWRCAGRRAVLEGGRS
jgi:uncharacterized membrane protein YbhN (UPF0104 family)